MMAGLLGVLVESYGACLRDPETLKGIGKDIGVVVQKMKKGFSGTDAKKIDAALLGLKMQAMMIDGTIL